MVTYKRDLPVWSGWVKNSQFPWNYTSGFLYFSPATAHISVGAEDKTVLYNIYEKCRYSVLFHHLRRNNTILYQKSFSHIVPHLCFSGTSTHYLSFFRAFQNNLSTRLLFHGFHKRTPANFRLLRYRTQRHYLIYQHHSIPYPYVHIHQHVFLTYLPLSNADFSIPQTES